MSSLARTAFPADNRAMADHPSFESVFLTELATAFRNRRRALSHRACNVELIKAHEEGDSGRERLEIQIGGIVGRGPLLRLHAWNDRLVWLDARRPAKEGWAWSWTTEGVTTATSGASHLLDAIEETWLLIGDITAGRTETLQSLWAPHLAPKPES
jgi:hypothetical protein